MFSTTTISKKEYNKIMTDHDWNEWRLDFSHEEFVPRDVPEEGLLLHVLRVALARTQTTVGVLAQKLKKKKC
jgi:hypothetical protein